MYKYLLLILLSFNVFAESPPKGAFLFTITDATSGIDYHAYIAVEEVYGDYWIEARYLNNPNDTEYKYIAGPDIPEGDQYYATQQDLVNIVDGALIEINTEIAAIFGEQPSGGDLGWLDKVKLYIMNSLVESDNVIRSK